VTQSGQGEEPSARPAREGIVLPSDGGEPLLPGMTGGQGGRPIPAAVPPAPPAGPPPSAPPGGQSWGTPWGPDQNQNPAPPPAPGQGWGTQAPQYQQPSPAPWGAAPQTAHGAPSQPLPPEGPSYGAPSYGHGAQGAAPMPAPQQPYGHSGPPSAPLPPAAPDVYGAPGGHGGPAAPLPPAQGSLEAAHPHAGAPLPPPAPGGFGAPLPPADEGATQYIPPVAAPGGDEGATQYIPPVAAAPGGDEGATQFLPPVASGALSPEMGGGSSEHTPFLGHAPQGGGGGVPGAGPMPSASGPDAEATQFIPPVPGQPGRQPLADFDNLFRSEPGGDSPAGATQQLPRFQQPQQHQRQPQHLPHEPQAHHAPEPGYFPPGGHDDGGRRGGRTGSKVPLIAAVGVGIAVLGVGAGAMLAGGGGGDKDDNKPVAATAPATGGSASPSADPAKQQAVALDKLLATSGDSRTAVIKAVAAVKTCDNLGKAAQDLRDAAKQRTQLVTDLSGLTVDQLPNHAALTSALTKAWQASASADNHYAAWADQVAGNKKLCKKGQARSTGQTQAGNRASGTASAQKKTAAQLWNSIAQKYGLTERQPTQL
jgi:hypothetical protein